MDFADPFYDQLDAATRHRDKALDVVGLIIKPPSTSLWERTAAVAEIAVAAWVVQRQGCIHLSTIQPAFLPVADPAVMFCVACFNRYSRTQTGTPEDNTCDLCRIVAGVGGIRPFAVTLGPVTVCGGVCRGCWGEGFDS